MDNIEQLDRESIAKLTEEYLRRGGKIEVLPPDLYGFSRAADGADSTNFIIEHDIPESAYRKPVRVFDKYPSIAKYEV